MSSNNDRRTAVDGERRRRRINRDSNTIPIAQVHGHIPGIKVGTRWSSRLECNNAHIHPGIIAGIYGSVKSGAYSIVLNGGYDDDLDQGEKVFYTGSGGREKARGGKQIENQTFDNRFNKSLQVSASTGLPVRVIRGYKLPSAYAPPTGYRYDGLYKVIRAYEEIGREGFTMCRFELVRLPGQKEIPYDHQFFKKTKKTKKTRTRRSKRSTSDLEDEDDRVSAPPDTGDTSASGSTPPHPHPHRPTRTKRERLSPKLSSISEESKLKRPSTSTKERKEKERDRTNTVKVKKHRRLEGDVNDSSKARH